MILLLHDIKVDRSICGGRIVPLLPRSSELRYSKEELIRKNEMKNEGRKVVEVD